MREVITAGVMVSALVFVLVSIADIFLNNGKGLKEFF